MKKLLLKLECDKALSKIRAGDISGLSNIFEMIGNKMYALAFSILNNHEDAEDAFQEAFLRIQQNIMDYDKSKNGYCWVLTITRNISIDILKSRRQMLDIDDYSDSEMVSVTYPIDEKLIIGEALQTLGEIDREIITLKSFSFLKYKEIAVITGLTVDAVEKRYQRSLKKLKEFLSTKRI